MTQERKVELIDNYYEWFTEKKKRTLLKL